MHYIYDIFYIHTSAHIYTSKFYANGTACCSDPTFLKSSVIYPGTRIWEQWLLLVRGSKQLGNGGEGATLLSLSTNTILYY